MVLKEKRKIFVVIERRADYSRYRPNLQRMKADPFFDIYLVVTGICLLEIHGNDVDYIKNDDIQMIINTPLGAQSRYDEYEIGKAANKHNIQVVTTISGAQAILRAIRMAKNKNLNYISLQEIFK